MTAYFHIDLTDGHIMGGAGGGSDTLVDVLGLGELQDTFASAGFGMATAAPPLDENRLTPGWEAGFKIFLFKNSGILFEDDSIQIGIKSEYKENLGMNALLPVVVCILHKVCLDVKNYYSYIRPSPTLLRIYFQWMIFVKFCFVAYRICPYRGLAQIKAGSCLEARGQLGYS